jgi:hypothetical protein
MLLTCSQCLSAVSPLLPGPRQADAQDRLDTGFKASLHACDEVSAGRSVVRLVQPQVVHLQVHRGHQVVEDHPNRAPVVHVQPRLFLGRQAAQRAVAFPDLYRAAFVPQFERGTEDLRQTLSGRPVEEVLRRLEGDIADGPLFRAIKGLTS